MASSGIRVTPAQIQAQDQGEEFPLFCLSSKKSNPLTYNPQIKQVFMFVKKMTREGQRSFWISGKMAASASVITSEEDWWEQMLLQNILLGTGNTPPPPPAAAETQKRSPTTQLKSGSYCLRIIFHSAWIQHFNTDEIYLPVNSASALLLHTEIWLWRTFLHDGNAATVSGPSTPLLNFPDIEQQKALLAWACTGLKITHPSSVLGLPSSHHPSLFGRKNSYLCPSEDADAEEGGRDLSIDLQL